MAFWKNYFGLGQIRQLWAGLSRSARMAMGLLVAVVALSLFMLVHYGGKPTMQPLPGAPLAAADLSRAEQMLSSRMPVEVRDGKLYVPADKVESAYGALASMNILPPDSISAFEELAKQDSMWRTEKEADWLRLQAKQAILGRMLSGFPGVRQATVMLEQGAMPRLGTQATRPSASVNLRMEPNAPMDRKLVASMVDLVVTAAARMTRADVSIVDATNGRSYHVNDDEMVGDSRLEQMVQLENQLNSKLMDQLRYIPNVIVAVHAVPDPLKTERTVELKASPDDVVTAPKSVNTESFQGMSNRPGGEAGVTANTSMSLGSLNPNSSTEERSRTENENVFPMVHTEKVAGGVVVKPGEISASVNIPRGYLMAQFLKLTRQDKEPDDKDTAFTTFVDDQLKRIAGQVMNSIGITDEKQVRVDWFLDGRDQQAMQPAQASVGTLVFNYGKPAALGGLALFSLLMVMMLVRKRNPTPLAVEGSAPLSGMMDAAIDQVESEEGALTGIELDEDTIRAQRVVEQVSEMVKQNPEAAANLVRRWLLKK